MDQEETAAPIPKGEEMVVMANVYPMTVENKHTCLERTSGEKKWTDQKTFYIRLNSRRNDQNYNNEVKDNSVKKDLELKFNIWLFCC